MRRARWSRPAKLSARPRLWRSVSWKRGPLRSGEERRQVLIECSDLRRSIGLGDGLAEVLQVPHYAAGCHTCGRCGCLPTDHAGLINVAVLSVTVCEQRQVEHSAARVAVSHL